MKIDPDQLVAHFASLVASERKAKGLSHQTLADMAGVHRSTISLVEHGKITPTILVCAKIAKALEVDLAELIARAQKKGR